MAATVAITRHIDDIGAAIERALAHMPLAQLVRGRRVAIKPNDTFATEDDRSGVTQGDTLRAVVRIVKRFDPQHIVVSGGAGAAETDEVFRLSGMMAVIEDEDVEFFDHNRAPFRDVDLEYGVDVEVTGPQKSVKVNPRVLEYETLIVLSQIKVHSMATITGALKNIAMSYPAADHYGHPRGSYRRPHHFLDDLHSFIAAMCRRFPIDLAVTVGHPAMVAHGPLAGYAVETGLCIASTDALAADTVQAALLGFEPQAVRHLWEAGKLGLGETELDQCSFPEMDMKEAIGAFTQAVYGRRMDFEHP